jgi:murein L,D-transpeptidase YafK
MENYRRNGVVCVMRAIFITLLWLCFQSEALAAEVPIENYEQSILDTIKNIQSQNHEQALDTTRKLIKQYPNSRLGQMLYGDLLLAKTEPLAQIGSGLPTAQALLDFTQEIQLRWQHDTNSTHKGLLPENILFMAENQPYVILVDQQSSRIYVYRNEQGTPVLETDYFITIGLKGPGKQKRGDQKTPIGIYHVTRYIDDRQLPDLYGRGAFPINYPNVWDERKQRTGGGIWIHGTPSYTYNRSPLASNGCIVVSNPDFSNIDQYIGAEIKTPVIVAQKVNWLTVNQWRQKRGEMQQVLHSWISDWESLNHDRYRQNYSQTDYYAHNRDFKNWDARKRWTNRNKTRIEVNYSGLNIFVYPGEENLVLMQFGQTYESNNYNVKSPKELYWHKYDSGWKIVYEGVRIFPRVGIEMVDN